MAEVFMAMDFCCLAMPFKSFAILLFVLCLGH